MSAAGATFSAVSGRDRVIPWLFFAGGIVFAIVTLRAEGWSGLGAATVGVLLLCGGALVALRVRVRATQTAVEICDGLRTRRYDWAQVEGFRVNERGSERGVFVLLSEHRLVKLPIANGGVLTRRRELHELRDSLEACQPPSAGDP